MTRRTWVRLDNASNIFLAARTDADPKVFRLGADVDHDVDPRLLQTALDATYERYPLYHAVLRRGVFWHYLQDSDLRPLVTAEDQPTCAPLYQADRRTLLFRVSHHRQRISLEVFHALSDGTGALWFLSDLVTAYLKLRYPGLAPPPAAGGMGTGSPPGSGRMDDDGGAPAGARGTGARGVDEPVDPGEPAEAKVPVEPTTPAHGLTADSFAHYFHRRRPNEPTEPSEPTAPGEHTPLAAPGEPAAPAPGVDFSRAATPAVLTVGAAPPSSTMSTEERARQQHRPATTVFRARGIRTPDNRTRAIELTMPAKGLLALARAEGVSPTMFLTALFFESIRGSSGDLGTARTLAASVPVNLRQHFPSTSARNFFATVRVEHTYGQDADGKGADDLGSIARQLERQFRPKATPEALERKLRRFIRLERTPALRIMPRPVKDVILRLVNWGNNRGLTISVSNLGRVSLPEAVDAHVGRMQFHVSAVRPQICAISHAGLLTVSFSSPFTEAGHVREFARMLSARGIEVTVAAARVTEEELAEGALADGKLLDGKRPEGEP